MNNPWKLIGLLIGIFLAGGATGALVTMRMCRPAPVAAVPDRPPPSGALWSSLHLKRIDSEIGLQPDQLQQIEPIVNRRMDELFNMRAQYLGSNRALREQMEREVAEKMTAEQREKYAKMNREYHEKARRMERGERVPTPPGKPVRN